MKRISQSTWFLAFLVFSSGNALAQFQTPDTVTSLGLQDNAISMIRLIANPERFHGFRVSVEGYLHFRFEDSGLYFSKTDADYLNGKNAIWASFADSVRMCPLTWSGQNDTVVSLSYFDGRYVAVSGMFDKDKKGHMGSFSATLKSIDFIVEERQWYDGREELTKRDMDGKNLRPKARIKH